MKLDYLKFYSNLEINLENKQQPFFNTKLKFWNFITFLKICYWLASAPQDH